MTSFVYKCQQTGFPNLACDQQVAPATRKLAKLLTGGKTPSKPFEFITQAWRQQTKGKRLHLVTRRGRLTLFASSKAASHVMLIVEKGVNKGCCCCCCWDWWKTNRELTLKRKLKCYVKPMKDPLGVSPSKGIQGTTQSKEKFLLTSVGIEPTTSGLDLPLLCRLSYEVGQRKSGTI